MNPREPPRSQLAAAVGIAAVVAPALHVITDVLEWHHGGFSTVQLWLNYLAFLPMPWDVHSWLGSGQVRPDPSIQTTGPDRSGPVLPVARSSDTSQRSSQGSPSSAPVT